MRHLEQNGLAGTEGIPNAIKAKQAGFALMP